MMGLPNFRLKLPSRNWSIFLTIVGSWSAAVIYDRREKKRIQKRYGKLVSHLAQETIDVHELPRKLTVYLSAPPGDGLVPAREHFNEYVKPILVSAALDWDAVEGRREGDVRAGLAERIRKLRKKKGEASNEPIEQDQEELLAEVREKTGIKEWPGTAGDIVIGRHAWKEYIRGLHEGWLGPLDPPVQPETVPPVPEAPSTTTTPESSSQNTENAPPVAAPGDAPLNEPEKPAEEEKKPAEEEKKPAEEEKKSKKKKQPPPFNSTSDYNNEQLSSNCPAELTPTTVVPFPHLLGFLNTPIRMYRFLNRRKIAEDVGRQTAAAVLAYYQHYGAPGELQGMSELSTSNTGEDSDFDKPKWEQERLLAHEEKEWHKSVRERKDDDGKERVWLDDIVLDPRIAERMRKFVLDMDAQESLKKIAAEKEEPIWSSLWPGKKENKQQGNDDFA
jgi:import inner membrane translocase subunit TIM54